MVAGCLSRRHITIWWHSFAGYERQFPLFKLKIYVAFVPLNFTHAVLDSAYGGLTSYLEPCSRNRVNTSNPILDSSYGSKTIAKK